MKKMKNKLVIGLVICFLFSLGGLSFARIYKYFDSYEDFQAQYSAQLHTYENAQSAYYQARQYFSDVCGDKLRMRCQYIQDKMYDFGDLDMNSSLFCKQAMCYSLFGSHLSDLDRPFELNECLANDTDLDLCVNGGNHRRQAFFRMGMQPNRTYLIPPKAQFYKVQRMIEAQNIAYDAGFTKEEAQALVYQLNVENGAWNERVLGDQWCEGPQGQEDYCFRMEKYGRPIAKRTHHCSFGIVQYNACAHHGISAETFMRSPRNADWLDFGYQVQQIVDFLAEKKEEYGDFERAQIHWNYPAASRNGYHTSVSYFDKLERMRERFTTSSDVLGAVEVSLDSGLDIETVETLMNK